MTRRAARDGAAALSAPDSLRAWSDVVHSHRTLEALKKAGCTALTIHFDHGFGLRAQANEFREAAEFAAVCHDLGLRVFAYVEAGALFYESLMAECPGLSAWAQRSPQGDPVPAESAAPAWRPCYLSSGFLDHLRDSVTIACDQIGADGIYLANLGPHDCHCERCQHTFRRLLSARHADPEATFGLPSFEHVRIPVSATAADPLSHEAGYFQVFALRSALAELRIHIRSLSAHLALWAEPRLGPATVAPAALWELCASVDALTCRVPVKAIESAADPLICVQPYAHALLVGQATRTAVCVRPVCQADEDSTTQGAARLCAEACTAMAFGGHVMANHAALQPPASTMPPESTHPTAPAFVTDEAVRSTWQRCLDFAARHEHYHHRATSLAEVALTFSSADIGARPEGLTLFADAERALLKACIPFDIVAMEAATSTQHRVLVVAGQAPITDHEGEVLCTMAREGRALILVCEAGTHDALGRQRRSSVFAPVMGFPQVRSVPAPTRAAAPGQKNGSGLQAAVSEALPAPPAVEVVSPPHVLPTLAIHAFRLPTGQATFHILNLARAPAEGLKLRVRSDLAPGRHIAWHEPDAPDAMLDCAADGPTVTTALPPVRAYGLVVTS